MMTVPEARAALQTALESQSPQLIRAARTALLAAEKKAEEKPKTPFEKSKKTAKKAQEDHEEPDGDEEPKAEDGEDAEAEGEEKDDDVAEGEGETEGEAESESEEGEAEAEPESEYESEVEDAEGESESESEDEDKPKMKKAKKAKKMAEEKKMEGSAAVRRLLATLGASSIAEATGRAAALAEVAANAEKQAKRAKKIEKMALVDKAFDAARRDGRVTKAEIDHLRPLYSSRPIAELKAYLAAKPRVAATSFAQESAAHYPSTSEGAPGVDLSSPFAQKALAAFGVAPDQISERAAARGMVINFPGGARR